MINNKCRVLRGLLKITYIRGSGVRRLRILLPKESKTRKEQGFCQQY